MISGLGDMSISLAVAAVGSALGTGVAGMAAVGAWKRAFMQNKAAPFQVTWLAGAWAAPSRGLYCPSTKKMVEYLSFLPVPTAL